MMMMMTTMMIMLMMINDNDRNLGRGHLIKNKKEITFLMGDSKQKDLICCITMFSHFRPHVIPYSIISLSSDHA